MAMRRRETNKELALKLKQQLEALSLTIGANAGDEGKLFGSVTNIDIERSLRERGFDIERRKILLAEPIKQLGEFTVPVRLDPEVEAGVKLTVAAS
jgi:large subunit ribosomal protein L9